MGEACRDHHRATLNSHPPYTQHTAIHPQSPPPTRTHTPPPPVLCGGSHRHRRRGIKPNKINSWHRSRSGWTHNNNITNRSGTMPPSERVLRGGRGGTTRSKWQQPTTWLHTYDHHGDRRHMGPCYSQSPPPHTHTRPTASTQGRTTPSAYCPRVLSLRCHSPSGVPHHQPYGPSSSPPVQ